LAKGNWILVRTQPSREHLAVRHVHRVGQQCYLPTFWDSKLKRRTVLFASYLFAFLRDGRFSWLNSLPGIVSVVHFGEEPAYVPAPIIAALKARENANGNVVLPSQEELAPGDRVRLLAGPFAQHVGVYQGMTTHERICVLLRFLSEYTPVYLERAAVERV
jgi:transcriptional antiterminator RfaH